jgi:hypothetical protein
MAGRVVEPGELQSSVLRGTFGSLAGKSRCVARREIPTDRGTAERILDQAEPPRLAQPHRRRERSEFEQPLDRGPRQRIAAKPPHVPPLSQQRAQAGTEVGIECRRGRHGERSKAYHHRSVGAHPISGPVRRTPGESGPIRLEPGNSLVRTGG